MEASRAFVSVDWGTTRLRLRLVDRVTRQILATVATDDGIRSLAGRGPAAFLACLRQHCTALGGASLPAIVSGMASAAGGWCELPYARVPFPLDGSEAVSRSVAPQVVLVSGLRSTDDILRGEETELVGLYARAPARAVWRDGLVILPGSHSKHVVVRDGAVVEFATHMTGELFDVLTRHSILRLTTGAETATLLDEGAFRDGVAESRRGAGRALFQARARAVLRGAPAAANRDFLSGVLIGSELAEAATWAGSRPVLIVAAGELRERYACAAGELTWAGGYEMASTDDVEAAVVWAHARWLDIPPEA